MNNLKSVHSAVKVVFIFFTLYDIRRIEAGPLGGMMSLTDILQNEVIIFRVVFLLFLPCFCAVVCVWNFPPFVPALPKPKFLAELLKPNLVPRDFSAAVPFCVNILYN